MKRILLCIASLWLSLTALTPQTARSQILIGLLLGEKVTTESFHLGIDIGVGLTNVSGISGTRVRTGLHFGLLGEWRFAERLYLQPGLLPFFNAGADDMPFKDFGLGQLDSLVSNKSATRKLNYVAVPIIVKYGFVQEKLLLGLGPQINFLTSAAGQDGTEHINTKDHPDHGDQYIDRPFKLCIFFAGGKTHQQRHGG
jgi:hypothetical protein